MTAAPDTYRGWTIHQGRWPEPAWSAFSPNYDASWEGEEDGWVDNGEKADADTFSALIDEIDDWFEDHSAPRPRLHPLVTSLWVAAGLLVAAHVVWVACGMPWL